LRHFKPFQRGSPITFILAYFINFQVENVTSRRICPKEYHLNSLPRSPSARINICPARTQLFVAAQNKSQRVSLTHTNREGVFAYISHARPGSQQQQQKHALRARSRVFYAIYGRHYCIGELGYMKMNLNLRSGKLERGSECITTTGREIERAAA
jgi:hypothetical protein